MLAKDAKEKLIQDYLNERKSGSTKTTAPPAPKKPLIEDKLELTGTHTWGELTGTTGRYKDYKTTVFSPEDWDIEVRHLIPEEDPNFVETDAFFRFAITADSEIKVLLHGPSGSGKDAIIRHYCAKTCRPYLRVTGMSTITPDILLGSTRLDEKGTYFNLGDAAIMCRHGGVLCISEFLALPSESQFVFQSALESDGYLSLTEHPDPTQRALPLHKQAQIHFTSNVRGVGDNASTFSSATNVLDASSANRLAYQEVGYPPADVEKKILLNLFPTMGKDFADKVVKFGNLIRQAYDAGELEWQWSTGRTAYQWVKMALIMGDEAEGLRMTFFDKLDDAEKGKVRGFWKTIDFEGEL